MNIGRLPSIDEPSNIIGLSAFTGGEGGCDTRDIERALVEREDESVPQHIEEDIAAEFKKRLSLVESAVGFSLGADGGEDEDVVAADAEGEEIAGYESQYVAAAAAPTPVIHTDRGLIGLSNEQKKQRILMNALSSIDSSTFDESDEKFSLDAEKINDKKNMLLEQITMLRMNLTDDGIKLDGVREVNESSPFEDVESVYKQLRYRNDHVRYCGFATEIAQVVAMGAEHVFDGEKSYFGYKPDLTGWSPTLKIKMRRLNYETSSIVGDFMNDYNMGNFARILFEVVPGAIVHMKMRANRSKAITLQKPTRGEISSAIGNIRAREP
jgi:hypothetical protein